MAVVNGVGTMVPVDKDLPGHEIMNILEKVKPYAVIYSGPKDAIMGTWKTTRDEERSESSFFMPVVRHHGFVNPRYGKGNKELNHFYERVCHG